MTGIPSVNVGHPFIAGWLEGLQRTWGQSANVPEDEFAQCWQRLEADLLRLARIMQEMRRGND